MKAVPLWYFLQVFLTNPGWAVYPFAKLRMVPISRSHLAMPQNHLKNWSDVQTSGHITDTHWHGPQILVFLLSSPAGSDTQLYLRATSL